MSAPKRILLVDDDESLLQSLAEQLDLHEDFETIGLTRRVMRL
jgi:DNA-binding NtrC family response regulator